MSDFNQDEFNEWVDALPRERQLIAFQRACIEIGYSQELKEDSIGIRIDGDLENPDFHAAVHNEFLRLYIDECFAELINEGKIKASGVADNGEICYELA